MASLVASLVVTSFLPSHVASHVAPLSDSHVTPLPSPTSYHAVRGVMDVSGMHLRLSVSLL